MPSPSLAMLTNRGDRRRFLVIYNVWAGAADGRLLGAVLTELRAQGCEAVVREAAGRAEIGTLISVADLTEFDAIAVAGGDGTINAVVERLVCLESNDRSVGTVPIGMIPSGTANVLAHELAIPDCTGTVVRTLRFGRMKRCTVARVASKVFVAMGTAGFDSHVVDCVSAELKRRYGKSAYWYEILRQAVRYDYPLISVEIDGASHSAASVAILNGSRYGGDHIVLPQAQLDAPNLHVVMMQRPGTWHTIRYLLSARRCRLAELEDVCVVETTREVRFKAPAAIPFQADGHIIGRTPLTVEVVPGGVTFLETDGAS